MKKLFKKLGVLITKFTKWLVLSSANPKQTSLFIRGVALGSVTYILFYAQLFNIHLEESAINEFIEKGVNVIEVFLILISAIMAAKGASRKIILTVKGENKALK